MAIKAGQVVYVQTTGEKVFVIGPAVKEDVTLEAPKEGFRADQEVLVRRPIATRDGITYEERSFYAAELETAEEQVTREFEELSNVQRHKEELRKQLKQGGTEALPLLN